MENEQLESYSGLNTGSTMDEKIDSTLRWNEKSPWQWVPTLYFMEGLPFTIIVIVSTIMYKNLKISNADITFYTGFLYIPWMIKPLWSWYIDIYKTKRWWIYTMEILVATSFIGVALSLFSHSFFFYSLFFFWLCAFFSSSHDIAADGFYLIALDSSKQALFIGQQNLFYQIAKLLASGFLVFMSGILISHLGYPNTKLIWVMVMLLAGIITILIAFYHKVFLPKNEIISGKNIQDGFKNLKDIITEFFKLENIWIIILFIMTFRIGENQIIKIVPLFLLDTTNNGGLGLSNTYIGLSNIMVLIAMIIAGILGGVTIYRFGLKKCIWWMFLAVNIPHFIYVYLAYALPQNESFILFLQVLENFATTFALSSYAMISFMAVKNSKYKTSHYAFITAFKMAGVMLPSMFSGVIQSKIGYQNFFIFVVLTMLPCLLIIPFLKIDNDFGKKLTAA